jgi:hippurate hydrolase
MEGSIRYFDKETCDQVCDRITEITENIAKAMNCTTKIELDRLYPSVVNPPTETNHIKRLATKWFGPSHVSDVDLPAMASEDFSYFLQEKPGCFFALGTLKPGHQPKTLHTSDYNFNDDMVATGGYFWLRVIEDRLNVKLLSQ